MTVETLAAAANALDFAKSGAESTRLCKTSRGAERKANKSKAGHRAQRRGVKGHAQASVADWSDPNQNVN